MKKLFSIFTSLLLCIMIFAGCGAPKDQNGKDPSEQNVQVQSDEKIKDSIVGVWKTEYKGDRQVYQFNEDGTGYATILPMTYTVEDGIVTMTISAFGETKTISAPYSVDNNTLSIVNDEGETIELTKTTMEELQNE